MSKLLRLAKRNRDVSPSSWSLLKEKNIVSKIRKRRTENEELAILRKAVMDLYKMVSSIHPYSEKNFEFLEYFQDVENCKEQTEIEMQ